MKEGVGMDSNSRWAVLVALGLPGAAIVFGSMYIGNRMAEERDQRIAATKEHEQAIKEVQDTANINYKQLVMCQRALDRKIIITKAECHKLACICAADE